MDASKWQKMHKMLLRDSKDDLSAKIVGETESKEIIIQASGYQVLNKILWLRVG